MSLEEVLKKAVERIRSGKLESEAKRKQAVILPILRALDWDDSDPAEVVPELSVPSGRVDYALLRQGGVPMVFIEAKAPGKADGTGEEQVFRYAYGQGVPFLILTDGDIWNFYLTTAFGPPADRRFYRAELTNDARIPDYVKFFEEYLLKSRVVSGEPLEAARIRHESVFERNRACKAIPGAWRKLLETPDDSLRALLIENTEKDCGARPDVDDVDDFCKRFLVAWMTSRRLRNRPLPRQRPRAKRRNQASPPPRRESPQSSASFLMASAMIPRLERGLYLIYSKNLIAVPLHSWKISPLKRRPQENG